MDLKKITIHFSVFLAIFERVDDWVNDYMVSEIYNRIWNNDKIFEYRELKKLFLNEEELAEDKERLNKKQKQKIV